MLLQVECGFHARASAVAMSHSSTLACMERRSNHGLFVTHVVSETCLVRFSLSVLLLRLLPFSYRLAVALACCLSHLVDCFVYKNPG